MAVLPINIDDILNGGSVEWERLEFKKGWNPLEVLHTTCAFANDINNWGGGYIFIGIEEADGRPVLPPTGLPSSKLDDIQKKLVELGNLLRPDYHPVVEPRVYQGKHILIFWCPGGPTRPYKAPKSLRSENKKREPLIYEHYIRRNSRTLIANEKAIGMLYERANQIPFDDQINHHAQLEDFSLSLIRELLSEVKSDLYSQIGSIPLKTLCRNMQIARGPEEHLMPINVGLMMFNENPELFFPYTRIEVVEFRDQEGDSFSEKIFKGPIHKQLSEALRYIQSMYIREEVRKVPNRAEADRFYNYPFVAIEESLANAIYHRDYKKREPIEVRIHPDRIEIQSFPGPLPPITIEELNKGQQIKVREYRNRRIGDFLKELHLTEGRCTGIPKIQRSMRDNGSQEALFETDENRSYFLTTLPIHPALRDKIPSESTQLTPESAQLTPESAQFTSSEWPESLQAMLNSLGSRPDKEKLCKVILELCSVRPLSATELSTILGRKSKKALVRDHLTPLKKDSLLQIDNPKAHAANQKYRTTVT